MLVTTICFLFIAQSFAKDLAPHAHQQVFNENGDSGTAIDYVDGIHLPNRHYKINYIYEQKRTYEDLEIEEIEEEIGKDMHYQPSTTTTTTESQNIDDVNESFKENHGPFETPIVVETHDHKYEKTHNTHNTTSTTTTQQQHQHNNTNTPTHNTHTHTHNTHSSTLPLMPPAPKLRKPYHRHSPTALPATVSSPPITQWGKIKEVPSNDVTGFYLDRPYFPARVPTPHRHPKRRLHISPTTSEAPIKVEAQKNHVSTKKHIHLSPATQVPLFKSRNGHDALARVRPILDDIKQGSIGLAPRPVYRGSYKFIWDDINDMHTSTAPKVSQLKENPIPSVPTLSPWYDGYGK